ncbi:cytochrome oxidase putative small subunit CydP [Pseudomonas oryzihabitans]|uniref:cytochrome oxidase putative small subunit CydP n=1 Tax=Pseudomonas oryzihabitans TaxID=47885 RepID=UPI00241DDD7C|nr:cytochrome oxidase putative small subunit CydP [Pseudomonas oryzihabitans]
MNGCLVKELLIILLIKLALLMVIKSLWFSAPTVPPDAAQAVPPDAAQAVSAHLLD